MLFRGSGSKLGNASLDVGDSNPKPWENWHSGVGGDIDMHIVLDTTRGYGNWTATHFARRSGTDDYAKVGQSRTLPNEAIRSVGIAVSGDLLHAKITDFSPPRKQSSMAGGTIWRRAGVRTPPISTSTADGSPGSAKAANCCKVPCPNFRWVAVRRTTALLLSRVTSTRLRHGTGP